MTKKVLVTEKLAQAGLDRLAEKGLQVDVKLKMSTDELIEAIPEYDALVVRSATHVTREVIAAASKLRIIGRAGVQIADYIAAGLEGSVVPTALNMAPVPPEVMDAVGPYVPACQMMGSMLAQLGGEVPKRLSLTASGKAAPADATILVAGTLQGLLSYKNLATVVTPVNAEAVARRHGIRVDTGAHASAGAYSSSVTVVADGREIGCTLSGEDQHVRLISLLGYKVDIAPGPQALIFQYEDRPGRVGTIGSILGDAGINITTMQIVNDPEAGQAIVYMNIEGELDDSVLAKLRENLEDPKNLWYVKL